MNWLEWLGYLASLLIAVSLLMSSLVKLRWVNLIGSMVFAAYGFLIGAIPVVVSNSIIVLINIYYLYKIYTEKEYFNLIEIKENNDYLKAFFQFYKKDIKHYFPQFEFNLEKTAVSFWVLRNMVPACIYIASEYDKESLLINLDFVIPEYRDFKIGSFIFEQNESYFRSRGYTRFISDASGEEHYAYLRKMGFKKEQQGDKSLLVRYIGKGR